MDHGCMLPVQNLRISEGLYKIAVAAAVCLPTVDSSFCVIPGGYLLQVSWWGTWFPFSLSIIVVKLAHRPLAILLVHSRFYRYNVTRKL